MITWTRDTTTTTIIKIEAFPPCAKGLKSYPSYKLWYDTWNPGKWERMAHQGPPASRTSITIRLYLPDLLRVLVEGLPWRDSLNTPKRITRIEDWKDGDSEDH